jgi:diguanylate cyclase (GGDEF)-like protein/PAS domain S-box-containing protein
MIRDALAPQQVIKLTTIEGVMLPAHGALIVLPEHVCIVDADSIVRSVDDAWPIYAETNYAGPDRIFVGCNYLLGCESNSGPSRKHAAAFASGLRSLLSGRTDHFTIEYACKSLTAQHWIEARISRLPGAMPQIAIIHRDVTARHRVDQELQRLRSLLSATDDAIILVDPITRAVVDVNDATVRLLGRERSSYPSIPLEMLFPETGADARSVYSSLLSGYPSADPFETALQHADTGHVAVEIRPREVRFGEQTLIALVTSDIRERRRVELLLRRQALQHHLLAQFGQLALENPPLNVLTTRATELLRSGLDVELCRMLTFCVEDHILVQVAGAGWDEGWAQQPAFDAEAETEDHFVIGTREAVIVHDFESGSRFPPSPILAAHRVRSAVEVLICGKEGAYGLIGAYARAPGCFDTESANFVRSVANTLAAAIDRGRGDEQLTRLAQFDSLTGLPNRSLYLDRLGQTLVESERDKRPVAVLFVDVDHFKDVNDTLGHSVGDQLLVQIADRLRAEVRPGDTVGRLGGDEFTVTLAHLGHDEDAGAVAKRIVESIGARYQLGAHSVHVSASVGVSLYPNDGHDANALLKCADTAMYRAKESGRSTYQFYLPKMNDRAVVRMKLEGELRGALERGEYLLHYQPRVSLQSGEISGLEALLRWQPAADRLVAPEEFIPSLEESGLIVPVGEWVIASVCAQIGRWRQDGIKQVPVAVNLSARQFRHIDIDAAIGSILSTNAIDPALLELDLTESTLMTDSEAAIQSLRNLKARGIRVAVDDFGTGYSSLMYLKRFPIDYLKIDRGFIRMVTSDSDSAEIAIAITNLAHSLKLKVIAEGVETRNQLEFLRANGCDEMQGNYYSKALPEEQITEALRANRRLLFSAGGAASSSV